jgi:hypothetical protein
VWLPAGTQRNAAANLAEYNQFRHPVERNAATEYNVMPPLDWWPDERFELGQNAVYREHRFPALTRLRHFDGRDSQRLFL